MRGRFIILGPHQPGNDIDMYLRQLVDDLKTLWSEGVQTTLTFKIASEAGMIFNRIG